MLALSSCALRTHEEAKPAAHILMPAYNAHQFILKSTESVVNQTYPNLKLIIFDDGSTDETFEKIQQFLAKRPDLKEKVHLQSNGKNYGISHTRTKLIECSKRLDPKAYIFWLDADDQYTDPSFVKNVMQQMQKTQADICIFNFSIVYEDEKQKANAIGLVKEKDRMAEIIQAIRLSPTQFISPLQLPSVLEITSLGWVKCYAPTVKLPIPLDCAFEDFVYMAALLEANVITALPAENEPIQYLRRSSSICGQRKSKHFTDDIPNQLKRFFDAVLESNWDGKDRLQKIKLAQEFVSRKLKQYSETLEKIVETKSHSGIDQKTFELYRKKAEEIGKYVQANLLN